MNVGKCTICQSAWHLFKKSSKVSDDFYYQWVWFSTVMKTVAKAWVISTSNTSKCFTHTLLCCFTNPRNDELGWYPFHHPQFTVEELKQRMVQWLAQGAMWLIRGRTRIWIWEVCLLNTLCCFSLLIQEM